MKLLLDNNATIVFATEHELIYNDQGYATESDGVRHVVVFPQYNTQNSSIETIDGYFNPAMLVNKYKYVNGELILNKAANLPMPVYDSMFFAANDLPLQNADDIAEERVNKTIEMLKSFHGNVEFMHYLDQNLIEGLFYLDTEDSLLSPQQIELKKVALNWRHKMKARFKIAIQVGDIYDLVADIAKQVYMLTGMLTSFYANQYLGYEIPETNKLNYDSYCSLYRQLVDNGQYKDRADLEDPVDMVNKLLSRNLIIADIINSEYWEKKQ